MSRRGHDRERAVVAYLRERDWFAMRAPGSLGVTDVIALAVGKRPLFIEVKSTAYGPYDSFLPADRKKLSLAARLAGADAVLVWWPPRGKMHWIVEAEWPENRAAVA